ncbi:hypothetical protein MMPV_000523 [Pyropia vietnamensis]
MGGGGDGGRRPLPAAVLPTSGRRRGWTGAALRAAASGLAVVVALAPSRVGVAAQAAAPPSFPLVGHGDYWHSFGHPFESTPEEPLMHWEVKGGTILTSHPDTGRDVVRLTPALQGRAGILFNTVHSDTNDFNAYIDFEIKTTPASREAADGFAFWYLRDVPDVGPSMGISDKFMGLGVVVDTFANSRSSRTPYVYAYVNDGTVSWDASTDGKTTQLTQGCHVEINKPTRMYVSLQGQVLRVALSTARGFSHRYDCFTASGVRLGFSGSGIFAVSAETGHYFATHDVMGVQIMSGHHTGMHGEMGGHEDHYDDHEYDREGHHPYDGKAHSADGHGSFSHGDHDSHDSPAHGGSDHMPPGVGGHPHDRDFGGLHHEVDSHVKLDAVLDRKVSELRDALTDLTSSTAEASADKMTLSRLDSIKTVILELLDEASTQSSRFQSVSSSLSRMSRMSTELRGTSSFFENELRQAEAAVETLHYAIDELRRSQGEVLSSLSASHEDVRAVQEKQGSVSARLLRVLLFVLSQAVVGGLVWAIAKSSPDLSTAGSSRRKL